MDIKEKRKRLHKFLRAMGDKITYTDKITKDTTIVCSLVENFKPENNDVWQFEINKSYPREGIVCSTCKKPVVLSGGTFMMYEKAERKSEIACTVCMLKKLELEKSK